MEKPKKVLVVDDDPAVPFVTERILKRMGVEAELLKAKNGKEALEIVREVCQQEDCPELILLDINMPVMDGFEFLEEIQKASEMNTGAIKVVLLSSSQNYLDLAKAKQYPVIDYLEKPITAEVLSKYL